MRVAGVDYSSRFVDIVTVPFDGPGAPAWHRFPLVGADAFDRARSVADALPGRSSAMWDDVLAVGIEDPRGQNAGAMYRVQGAILARLPARMLVRPFIPSEWRKAVGLPGNASKGEVGVVSVALSDDASLAWSRHSTGIYDWPQDAHDAHCIALATRQQITTEQAA